MSAVQTPLPKSSVIPVCTSFVFQNHIQILCERRRLDTCVYKSLRDAYNQCSPQVTQVYRNDKPLSCLRFSNSFSWVHIHDSKIVVQLRTSISKKEQNFLSKQTTENKIENCNFAPHCHMFIDKM